MQKQCPRCRSNQLPDAAFCSICANPLPAASQSNDSYQIAPKKNKSLLITIAIIAPIFGMCGLMSFVGIITSSNKSKTPAAVPTVSVADKKQEVKSANANTSQKQVAATAQNKSQSNTAANLSMANTAETVRTLKNSPSPESSNSMRRPSTEGYSVSERSVKRAPEPATESSGASARCRDGSLSFSAHRRGTCSHHGGVAEWY